MAVVIAVCISEKRGVPKKEMPYIDIQENHGIIGDAHAGNWHRQISLLALESIDAMRGLGVDLPPGAFAENIITQGLALHALPVGSVLQIGEAELIITQIGKECHSNCAIMETAGQCIMPTRGVFAAVKKSGRISPGDAMTLLENNA